ncbi:MAG: glycosyltransferase [Pseudomonadota bacterium]
MSSIVFVPRRKILGRSKGKGPRGVSNTTIALAECLAKRGHHVECVEPNNNKEVYNGVIWDTRPNLASYDLAIANLYPKTLGRVKAKQKCLWLHNPMNKWSRFRKCITGIALHRPSAVFLSHQQHNITPAIIPYKSRHVIEHGIDDAFLRKKQYKQTPDNQIAIFSSAPHRNLDRVIDIWKNSIHPILPNAELHIYCDPRHVKLKESTATLNIKVKARVTHVELSKVYESARLLIYPGHEEETFCNAAHEATACGLPIVTQGIGVLSERVTHGKNGIIAKDNPAMATAIIDVLSNDTTWQNLHRGSVEYRGFYTWDNRAEIWENTFL